MFGILGSYQTSRLMYHTRLTADIVMERHRSTYVLVGFMTTLQRVSMEQETSEGTEEQPVDDDCVDVVEHSRPV